MTRQPVPATPNPTFTRRADFRGNRRVNSVLHIASVTQARQQPQAAAYLARIASEGKTRREARRANKRHLANRVIRRMWRAEQTEKHLTYSPLDKGASNSPTGGTSVQPGASL